MIRCRATQLAPIVNVPRIRRRLVARFSSKPCLEEIHSILSFCIGRMSISMAHGKPWMDSRTRSTAAHLVMNVSYATRPETPSRNSWLHPSHKCGTSSDSCRKLHVCISRYLVSGSCRDAFLRALDLTTPTCLGKSSETQIVLDRRTQTRPNTMNKSSCFLKLR